MMCIRLNSPKWGRNPGVQVKAARHDGDLPQLDNILVSYYFLDIYNCGKILKVLNRLAINYLVTSFPLAKVLDVRFSTKVKTQQTLKVELLSLVNVLRPRSRR